MKAGSTGIENHRRSTIPARYYLDQNLPNPFNTETEIKYQMPTGSFVSLKVFDVLGRKVLALVNEYKNAGMNTTKLSMQNSGLQSGIYFYRMQAGDFYQTEKMALIK